MFEDGDEIEGLAIAQYDGTEVVIHSRRSYPTVACALWQFEVEAVGVRIHLEGVQERDDQFLYGAVELVIGLVEGVRADEFALRHRKPPVRSRSLSQRVRPASPPPGRRRLGRG